MRCSPSYHPHGSTRLLAFALAALRIRTCQWRYASVNELAADAKLNSKLVRNELRLAFLAREVLDAIMNGGRSPPTFEGSQQSAGVRSAPNYTEIAGRSHGYLMGRPYPVLEYSDSPLQ
jgi:hypothetical protein